MTDPSHSLAAQGLGPWGPCGQDVDEDVRELAALTLLNAEQVAGALVG